MPAEVSPATTYISAAIPPGCIDHYVLLMTPADLRGMTQFVLALGRVVSNISQQNTEAPIRQLKLNWFLEEVEMVSKNQPRHPLTIELASAVPHCDWLEPLQTLIRGALIDTTMPTIDRLELLLPFCHRAAQRQALMASVLPGCDEPALDRARQLGVGICLTEVIRDLNNKGSRVTKSAFADDTTAETLARLARQHFESGANSRVESRRAQGSVLLQARLYRRFLLRLENYDFDSQRAAMRPPSLLWHAWREARKLAA